MSDIDTSMATLDVGRAVTGISRDPRAPANLVIEVAGARFGSVPFEEARSLGLWVGQLLDDDTLRALRALGDAEAAYRVALRVLGARPRSLRETLRALRDKGHEFRAATHAVQRLEAAGLLDDDAFARHFARTRSARGHGAVRLVADLRARGVDGSVAERAVQETLEAEGPDPVSQARDLARKRSTQLGDLPRDVKRRRLMAYLGRRGFRGYEFSKVIEEALGESGG